MNSKILLIFMFSLLFVGCGQKVDYAKQAQATETSMSNAAGQMTDITVKTTKLLRNESEFLKAYSQEFPANSVKDAQIKYEATNKLYVASIVPVLKGTNPKDEKQIKDFNSARSAVDDLVKYINTNASLTYNGAKQIVDARDRLPSMKKSMQNFVTSVSQLEKQGSKALDQACRDCAFRKDAIKKQYGSIESSLAIFNRNVKTFNTALTGDVINYKDIAKSFSSAESQSKILSQEVNKFISKIAELETSYSKTLKDMRYNDKTTKYEHQYAVQKNGKVNESWITVSESVYENNIENMLMDLESKPLCYFNSEKVTVAAPAGMNMVGNPKYGNWKDKNGNAITESQAQSNPGNSFWHYYGQYYFWSNMLWGPNYRYGGYGYNDYGSYRSHRSRNTSSAYYGGSGTTKKYGSNGSVTKKSSTYTRGSFGKSGGTAKARSRVKSNKTARAKAKSRSNSSKSRSGSSRRGGGSGRGGK